MYVTAGGASSGSWLSDRARPVVVPVLLGALALLLVWWARATADGRVGIARVLDAPAGTAVVLSLLAVRSVDGPDRYVVGRGPLEIPVAGSTVGIVVGEELTVGGIVADGHVVERWRAPAPARPAKKALGIAGLLLAGGVLSLGVRATPRGLATRG